MSRLIVKNLPKSIKEDKLRSLFASKGEITDLRLSKTKEGKFRQFGFVGFKTEDEAQTALRYFNNSFIDTSKIQVEIARNLGEKSVTRPWSKYSQGSSAFQKRILKQKEEKNVKESVEDLKTNDKDGERKNKKMKSKAATKVVDGMEDDAEFQEFLTAHQHRSTKSLWSNDGRGRDEENSTLTTATTDSSIHSNKTDKNEKSCDDSSDEGSANSSDESDVEDENKDSRTVSNLSDMDYLKSKMVTHSKDSKGSDDDDDDDEKDSGDEEDDDDVKEERDSGDDDDVSVTSDEDNEDKNTSQDKQKSQKLWTVKMRGLPFKVKDKHIFEFFSPMKCAEVRFVKNKKGQPSGKAFVDFSSKEDLDKALKRDKDYLEGRYIELFRDDSNDISQTSSHEQDEKPWMKKLKEKGNDDEDESIGESGRLFLRNLAYTCTEEDIQKLFEKHGPLSEVNLPLDKNTNKTIGIGYVMFLMPEHAVKAFNELDGCVFQGRLLHILPSKAKKTEEENSDTNYKKKNETKKKSQSSSDHNWNTLFLGVNAVADVMADKYNTTKRGILDAESSNSLAVRMALGETQIVADTRKFLVEHGVKLNVFGQPISKRSKTVIIAKNLPFGTKSDEVRTIFSPFGQLGRVILPPTGITALIELPEPSAARKAFQKLAYTKFKNSLFYLEWAPVDVFVEGSEQLEGKEPDKKADNDEDKDVSDEESENEEEEANMLFVKNLNFETTEETIKEKFGHVGTVKNVTIAKKKDSRNKGALLSMGYGFVEFKKKSSALKALKELQHCMVDEHALELKTSNKKSTDKANKRHQSSSNKQKSSKILVRNVPFEATTKELRELFSTFGEIKTLRLPKKVTGTGPHRGFAFVDFLTKQDAKRAFEALSTSTHLYGRRLVLEWAEEDDDVDTLRKRTAEHFHGEPQKSKKKMELLNDLLDITENP